MRNGFLFLAGAAVCAVLVFSSTSVRADDCRACERYTTFVTQFSLAKEVADVGTDVLHREGRAFGVDAESADALLRRIQNDSRIPPECRDYVASKVHVGPRFSVVMTGQAGGSPPGFKMTSDTSSGLLGVFNNMLSHYDPCKRGDSNYVSCLQTNANSAYSTFSNRLANGTTQQLITELAGYGNSVTADGVALLKAYNEAINTGSQAGLQAWSAGAAKRLGTDGFLNVVQMVGWQMNNGYNFNRSGDVGDAGKGVVTVDQMLAGMRTNQMFMINGWKDKANMLADYEGVCRDAAVVQAQMLHYGGFPNSYTVGYKDQGGGHVDIITQDPNDRLKLYTLNWYGRATHQGLDGSQVLFQGSGMGIPDYTLKYTISDYNGKQVATVPSEMGKFLNEASGGDIATWDPLARANSSILAVSVSPDPKGHVQIRALYGTDGNGASYMGGAVSASWGEGTHFPGEAGVFGGQQLRPAAVYGASADGTTLLGYGQVVQHAISPTLQLGPNVKAVVDAHVALQGVLSNATSGPDHSDTGKNTNEQWDHRAGVEVRVDQTALNGRLKAQYVLGGTTQLGWTDVRNSGLNDYSTLVPLNGYAGARATLDTGGVTLFGQTLLVVDQLGLRDKVEAGVATRKVAASVYETGRVTDGTALIQDNTIRRVGLSLSAQPVKSVRLGVLGEIPVEGDPAAGARVYGTAAILF